MISIVLPTLGDRIFEINRLFESLLLQSYKNFEVILIVQNNFEEMNKVCSKYNDKFKIKVVESRVKGLSVSRNIAMKYIDGDIVIFSDDDAWYFRESLEIIKEEICDKDIICMQIEDPIKKIKYKNYNKHKKVVDKFQLLKKSSIEICVNLKKVNKEDIVFNEDFGLGARYRSGEENIFLNEMLKNNKKIEYIAKVYIYHEKKQCCKLNEIFIEEKVMVLRIIYGSFKGKLLASSLVLKNIKRFNIPINKILLYLIKS